MNSTAFLLEQWGLWAWQDRGIRFRYPGQSVYCREVSTTRPPSPMISDLCAQEIDHAVSRVYKANKEAGGCLIGFYLLRWPYHKIAAHLDVDRARVPQLVRIAEAGVSEVLDAD